MKNEWRKRMIQTHQLTGETCMYVRADIADEMMDALKEALEVGFGERDETCRTTNRLRRAVAKAEER